MKHQLGIFMAALVAAFVLSVPVEAWDAGIYGYPADVVTYARSVCYDPGQAIGSGWSASKPVAYKWLEPRNNWQKVVYDMPAGVYTLATAGAYRYEYSPGTLGAWLASNGLALTKNPWLNTDLLGAYMQSTHDSSAERADLYKQFSAGWPATPENIAAWNKRVDETMSYNWGPTSYQTKDNNGFTVKNAAGYTANQPNAGDISWWVKPTDCSPATLPTVTPISNPPQPTPAPSTQPWCKNPTTGVCAQLPSMFGNVCPDGWIACGTVTPTPTRTPTVNPTPLSSAIVACLATDGRYAYPATVCRPDEIPLVRK